MTLGFRGPLRNFSVIPYVTLYILNKVFPQCGYLPSVTVSGLLSPFIIYKRLPSHCSKTVPVFPVQSFLFDTNSTSEIYTESIYLSLLLCGLLHMSSKSVVIYLIKQTPVTSYIFLEEDLRDRSERLSVLIRWTH